MTEPIYNVTVTQTVENDKKSRLISNGWHILKADSHTWFK